MTSFEEFPQFVQIVLPAPAADVIQQGLRLATDRLADTTYDIAAGDPANPYPKNEHGKVVLPPDVKLQVAEMERVIDQLDQLAEFFDDIALNPAAYPVKGGMAASIKKRQRQWKVAQPKRPRRKKGQSRRAFEARVARWGVAQQEQVKAYNEARDALVLADLPVNQQLLDAITLHGATVDDIRGAIEAEAAVQAEQQAKYEAVMAALEDAENDAENEGMAAPPEIILP